MRAIDDGGPDRASPAADFPGRRWRRLTVLALLGCTAVVDAAPLRHLPQLSSAPIIDGNGDDAVWDAALSLPLGFEVSPQWGVPITATATAKVGTTATGLHVLVTVEQPTPIKATAAKHDRGYGDGISVSVQPDPETLRVFRFEVYAAGATNDTIGSSAGAGSPNWNGVWQSAAHQTAYGYRRSAAAWRVDVCQMGVGVVARFGGLVNVGRGATKRLPG